jgi:glucosamine--fructose-6-phosphate aminotransferase (isomerizing)
MCGIVGAVSERQVSGILLEGLSRLEYRGYDSAGMAIHDGDVVGRLRRIGKVQALKDAQAATPIKGTLGIAHTRWATHGVPAEHNAHPHMSGDSVAVVHNGIIENFESLKAELIAEGFVFSSETDTEVIAHLLESQLKSGASLLEALPKVIARLEGAFALGVVQRDIPDQLFTARKGSPLVIGVGIGENFIASDQLALLPVTDRFMFLEDGDIGCLTREEILVWDATGKQVERPVSQFEYAANSAEKGEYKHFMLKARGDGECS